MVEFGERNENGVSVFKTTDAAVASAVRRSSLSRRGVITEKTEKLEPAPVIAPSQQPKAKKAEATQQNEKKQTVREYANFTLAREAIIKEFDLKKSEVRNPTALARVAQEHGFNIKYLNAEK